MVDIESSTAQLKLINKAKSYLKRRSLQNKRKVAYDPSCYLNAWATGSLGYLRLQCLDKGPRELFNYSYQVLRNILGLRICSDYKIVNIKRSALLYKNIVISWSRQTNFLSDGSFQCSYFGVNSKSLSDTMWFLLSLDNVYPSILDDNIRIFIKNSKNVSVLSILENIWQCIVQKSIPVPESTYANALVAAFKSEVLVPSIKSVLMAYEAQPWQHALNKSIKAFDSDIKTIGYLHSSLPPLPTDFIKRDGEPDSLFVHGQGQKKILQQHLGWENKNINVIESLRFQKKTNRVFAGKIFIPYDFAESDLYIHLIEDFFNQMDKSIPPLQIENHPVKLKSEKHVSFIKHIESLLAQYQSHFSTDSKRQVSLILGITTSVLECLARGIEVIHIFTNPVYESYSPTIWQDLKVNRISSHIVSYTQERKSEYISLGERACGLQSILEYD